MHFLIMCISALPPASLGSCSVGGWTLKIAPFHMNQDIAVFICLTLSVGGEKIWVVYHAVGSMTSLTLWRRNNFL